MAKILVTGASGLSGSLVIEECVRQNIPARALVRSNEKAKELAKYPNVKVYVGDLLMPETYQDALRGIEKVLLISSAFEKINGNSENFL